MILPDYNDILVSASIPHVSGIYKKHDIIYDIIVSPNIMYDIIIVA